MIITWASPSLRPLDWLGSRVAWVPSRLSVETLVASRMLETTPPADALGKTYEINVVVIANK